MIKNIVKPNELYITQRRVFPIWSITLSPVEKGKMSVPYILQNNDNKARFLFNVIISEAIKGQCRTLGKQFFSSSHLYYNSEVSLHKNSGQTTMRRISD